MARLVCERCSEEGWSWFNLGWGSRIRQHLSVEQEERQAIIRVFKEIQEDKRVVEVMTNLKFFGEWVKWEAAMQLDWC